MRVHTYTHTYTHHSAQELLVSNYIWTVQYQETFAILFFLLFWCFILKLSWVNILSFKLKKKENNYSDIWKCEWHLSKVPIIGSKSTKRGKWMIILGGIQTRFRESFLIFWLRFLEHWKILPRMTSESSPLEMFLSKNKQNIFSTPLPKGKDTNYYMMSQGSFQILSDYTTHFISH